MPVPEDAMMDASVLATLVGMQLFNMQACTHIVRYESGNAIAHQVATEWIGMARGPGLAVVIQQCCCRGLPSGSAAASCVGVAASMLQTMARLGWFAAILDSEASVIMSWLHTASLQH